MSSTTPKTKKHSNTLDSSRPAASDAAVGPVKTIETAADLTLDDLNANRGTSRGRALVAESLQRYGAGRSIVVDRKGRIIAGNKTVEQARKLELPIRTVQTDGRALVVVQRTDLDLLSDDDARQLALADNRASELGLDWDTEILAQFHQQGMPLDGLFTDDELQRLIGRGLATGQTDDDVAVTPPSTTIVRGDLFELGPHRLLCGDATSAESVRRVLADAEPVLMVTDPPYGVEYDPAWRHRLAPEQRTAVGQVANDDRVDWSAAYCLFPGPVVYVWHAALHVIETATLDAYLAQAIEVQVVCRVEHLQNLRTFPAASSEPLPQDRLLTVRIGRSGRIRIGKDEQEHGAVVGRCLSRRFAAPGRC